MGSRRGSGKAVRSTCPAGPLLAAGRNVRFSPVAGVSGRPRRLGVASSLAQPAARGQLFAGEPASLVRSEKDGDARNVAWPPSPAERRLRDRIGLELGADEAGGM